MENLSAKRIKKVMYEHKLSATELAVISGLHQSTIAKIIKGTRKGSKRSIRLIAQALGEDENWLAGGDVMNMEEKGRDVVKAMELELGVGNGGTENNSKKDSRKGRPRKLRGRSITNLRELIDTDKTCQKWLEVAERSVKKIFKQKSGQMLPYFTKEPLVHCNTVEKYLNEILFGGGDLSSVDFIATPEEALLLLLGVMFHDIGLIVPTYKGRKGIKSLSKEEKKLLRETYELRSSEYILEELEGIINWDHEMSLTLANICQYHRRHQKIEEYGPSEVRSKIDGRMIRAKALAALLRLANSCDAQKSRPANLQQSVDSTERQSAFIYDLEGVNVISDVEFDHMRREIRLKAVVPPVSNFNVGEFDLEKLVEFIRQGIEYDLKSVQTVLMEYANTAFLNVKYALSRVAALEVQNPKKCLAAWQYLLDLPSSSTELCAALAQIILFAAERKDKEKELDRERISSITTKIYESNYFEAMVCNIYHDICRILAEASDLLCKSKLLEYLRKYSKNIVEKEQKMIKLIVDRKILTEENTIVIYGYSKTGSKLLSNIQKTHMKPVYIVTCNTPIGKFSTDTNMDNKMKEFVKSLSMKAFFVGLSGIYMMFEEIKGKETVVILGTHGVLHNGKGDFLCKAGSRLLITVAREAGAKILVLSKRDKFFNEEDSKRVEDEKDLLKLTSCQPRFPSGTVHGLTPRIDIVKRKLIDAMVTEDEVK